MCVRERVCVRVKEKERVCVCERERECVCERERECVCILALVIQEAKPMCPIILSSMCCPALPCFATLSHKRYNFRKKSH